jgi:hypothetical protein
MPIRINLLAEALAAEDMRRRDPVKRAIYAGAFLVVLSLVWYSSTFLETMVQKQKLSQVQAQIQAITNNYALAVSNLKKIADSQRRLDALDKLTATRFLHGNLMNALQQTYVQNVRLSRLRVDQSYSAMPAVAAKTNGSVVIAARPAGVAEHVSLTMDAKDFSPNPGDQVNHFKEALLKQDYFNQDLDSTNGVRLSSMSALQTSSDSRPYVMFTLECRFLDRAP